VSVLPRIALFDLDGTLTDPKPGITGSLRYALDAMGHGLPEEENLDWVIGPPMLETLAHFLGADRAPAALQFYRARYGVSGLFENEVYAGIPHVLAELKASGWTMFVATSKMEAYAIRIVEHFGLAPFFTRVYGSAEDGSRSDKRELLRYLLDEEGLEPKRCMMIGDRLYDARGAKANGIKVTGVTWGFGSREELQAERVDALADRPQDLPGLLAKFI